MASLFTRNKIYQLAYLQDGKRKYMSLKTRDGKIARKLKKEIEAKILNGSHQTERPITLNDYLNVYQDDTSYRKRSTNVADLSRVKEFLRHHGKKTLRGISRDDIRSFLKLFNDHAPKTYNSVIGALHRFFRPALEQGYLLQNPVDGFKRKRVPQNLPRFLSDHDYMILEELSREENIYPMIVTARYTGLRLAELLHLEWEDFDWNRKLVRVLNKPKYGHTVKNYQTRVVPISEELQEKLLGYIQQHGLCFPTDTGTPYKHEGPRRSMNRLIKKSRLKRDRKRMGWHDLRHTFASRLAQQGVSLYKISKWLGHSDYKTTQIYAHFAPLYDKDIESLCINSYSGLHA